MTIYGPFETEDEARAFVPPSTESYPPICPCPYCPANGHGEIRGVVPAHPTVRQVLYGPDMVPVYPQYEDDEASEA